VRIHDVEGHLGGVKGEAVIRGHFQHVKVHARIFMASECDVAYLSSLLGLNNGFRGGALGEYSVGSSKRITS
jgi:hypothetical protein